MIPEKPICLLSVPSDRYNQLETETWPILLKKNHLDIQTILEEQLKDPVLQILLVIVSKHLMHYLILHPKSVSQRLCHHITTNMNILLSTMILIFCVTKKLYRTLARPEWKNVLPSLVLAIFASAHTHTHCGHQGIYETFANVGQYFFGPGREKTDPMPKKRLYRTSNQENEETWSTRTTTGAIGTLRNKTNQDNTQRSQINTPP